MHKSPPSALSWLVVFCAVLSLGLVLWSRFLPEAYWESSTGEARSTQLANLTPITSTEPPPTMDSTPVETAAADPTPAPMTPAETAAVPAPSATAIPPAPTDTPPTASSPPAAPLAAASPAATSDSPAVPASPAPTAQPSPTAPPSDATLAGPLPSRPAAGETGASSPSLLPPASAATPTPPAALDIMEVAKQPQIWPRQVLLLNTVRFAVVINGMNAGTIQVPAGRTVNLRKVNLDGTVEIELQGSVTKVKAQETDIIPRANAGAAAREKAALGAPSSSVPPLKSMAPSETIPTL